MTQTQEQERERSLGELVAGMTAQLQTLVKAEIELAKAEIKEDIKHAGIGGAMFAAAGLFGLYFLAFIAVASAFGIHWLGLGIGISFLIVACAFLVISGILGLVGKVMLGKMTKVARTKQTISDDVAWAKSLKGQLGSGGVPAEDELAEGAGRQAVGPAA